MIKNKLFEKRIGAYFQDSKIRTTPNINGDIYASWPMSKLTMYKDKMIIQVFAQGEFVIKYSDVLNLEKKFLSIQIHHKNKDIKPIIYLSGAIDSSNLFTKIKETVIKNKLNLKIKI